VGSEFPIAYIGCQGSKNRELLFWAFFLLSFVGPLLFFLFIWVIVFGLEFVTGSASISSKVTGSVSPRLASNGVYLWRVSSSPLSPHPFTSLSTPIASPWLAVKPLIANKLQSTMCRAGTNKRWSIVHQVKALREPNQCGKIILYFATWWSFIYNNLVLNVFPFPWFNATLALAAGSLGHTLLSFSD
jgi:hypothetical protein